MNWNWDHLRYFLSLADAGSLSLAAKSLSVSHTTVLRRVRAIESELETHLFDHTSAGYKLTPAGQTLYDEVKKMKQTMDDLTRRIGGVDQLIEGPVVITTTDTLGYHFMPSLIRSLCERYPELDVTLSISNRMSDMPNREADIALRTCATPPPQLVGRQVGVIRFTACASVAYVRQHNLDSFPSVTNNNRFIILDSSFVDTPFYQWLAGQLGENALTVTANGLMTAYQLCAAGSGITVLPTYLVDNDPSLVALATHGDIYTNDLWILSHVDLRDTARIRLVKRFLYDALVKEFAIDDPKGLSAV